MGRKSKASKGRTQQKSEMVNIRRTRRKYAMHKAEGWVYTFV